MKTTAGITFLLGKHSVEYYYAQLGRVTNVSERSGDDGSSTYAAAEVNRQPIAGLGLTFQIWALLLGVHRLATRQVRALLNNYDQFGHRVTVGLPMGQSNWVEYDSFGRVSVVRDFKKQRKMVRYDHLSRVATNFWFAEGEDYPSNSVEYYYEPLGRVTNITERLGDAASSTHTASVNPNGFGKRGRRYFAWLAPL